MHFRYISTKIQPKNLKQHFDWRADPLVTPLLFPTRNGKQQQPKQSRITQFGTKHSLDKIYNGY